MNPSLNQDQRAILDALDAMLRPWENAPVHDAPLFASDPALEKALAEAGFLEVAGDPDLGTVTAALLIERLARLPFAVEAAASVLVGPLLDDRGAGPLCLVDARRWRRPVRFLCEGARVVVLEDKRVSAFTASADQFRAEPNALFAYPVATLHGLPEVRKPLALNSTELRVRWQVGLAAECAGLLAGALASTVAHVSDRQQFGRPIATFQAIRHRLAEAQVRINGAYWLAMRAAADCDPGQAALAALYAAETARTCSYDFHQFLGAMGMTLEHPLHLWTYRLKLLTGELGGVAGHARSAADALWGPAPD
ncbi:MAG: acyl-CoA dehydrogenase [Alphaproteobacteria bacterium]|nr:acyl-CoA dehydrogenase [Alphaproteobacteria bacterium]